MPKRNNPFGDSSSLQLKTHVREKEVNTGVCQQTRMQAVYDRTQQLLYVGMKEMQDKHVSLDVNDNCMSHREETTKTNKSDLKQMHISKNCQLVSHEENSLMDMETDSNSCHGSFAKSAVVSNLDSLSSAAEGPVADVAGNCSQVLPSLGNSFGRSPSECSPQPAQSSSSQRPFCSVIAPSNIASNAFSHMRQAQLKNSSTRESHLSHRACHNCRQPIQSQDVMKCHFCENCVCCTCVRQCGSCLLYFCQLCSVINYDLPAERSFCLSCHER